MKKRVFRFLLVLVCLGAAAHIWWWYRPGERAAIPSASLRGPGFEDAVWIWLPFPHLNLAKLKGSVEDSDEVLAALSRLAGFDSPRELPTFGPFSLPPARDLVLALGEDGKRLRLEAHVDPVLAVIARLAGKVAGNPWLGGGVVETSAGRVLVQWSANRWRAVRGGLSGEQPRGGFSLEDPALAAIVLSRSSQRVPKGVLVLRREGEDLAMSLQGAEAGAPLELPVDADPLIFFLLEGGEPGTAGGLMFFSTDQEGGIRIGSRLLSPPGAAVMNPPDAMGRELPGESIFRLTRRKPVRLETSSWDVVAYSMAQARMAADFLEAVTPRLLEAENGSLELAVTLRPAAAEAEIGSLLELLGEFPMSSKRERQKWQDAHQVLIALASLERVTLITGTSPPEFHLVLHTAE